MYSIQYYVIKFVSYLRQVSGFLRFLHQYIWPPWHSWNIVESGIKHHNHQPVFIVLLIMGILFDREWKPLVWWRFIIDNIIFIKVLSQAISSDKRQWRLSNPFKISYVLMGSIILKLIEKIKLMFFSGFYLTIFCIFPLLLQLEIRICNSLYIEGTQVFKILLWLKCRTTIQHLFLCLISCNIG